MIDVKTGDIVHISGNTGIKSRDTKFVVIVCSEKKYYFPINTKDNPKYDCIAIHSVNHNFLRGMDRYISTSRIFSFSYSKITKKHSALSETEITKLAEHVRQSRTLTANIIKLILENIEKINKS